MAVSRQRHTQNYVKYLLPDMIVRSGSIQDQCQPILQELFLIIGAIQQMEQIILFAKAQVTFYKAVPMMAVLTGCFVQRWRVGANSAEETSNK